jgi:Ca2+-binding EF-hand superfamily protein
MISKTSFRPAQLTAALLLAGMGAVSTAGLAQSTGTTASPTNPSATMTVPPSKTEAPDSAFKKLDASAKGYVSKDDAAQLPGFDTAFQRADANKDGKLTQSEFNQAWAIYSGNAK